MKPRKFKRINPDTLVLIKQILLGTVLIATFALFLTGVWYGTRMNAFTIDTIAVVGGETIDHQRVRGIVEQELNGEYIGFIPRRFSYLYPKQPILETVSNIERVHSVVIQRHDRKTLQVSFAEYQPHALWCASVDSDACVFLGHDGYAFASAPRLRGGSFARFVHLTEQPEIGRTIVDTDAFTAALRLIELFEANEWFVSHIELDQVGDAFLHVVGGGELKVALNAPPETTVENLFVVLTSDEFQHIEPGNFAYIDLRFGSKVFVNETLAVPEEETASSTATTTEAIEVE